MGWDGIVWHGKAWYCLVSHSTVVSVQRKCSYDLKYQELPTSGIYGKNLRCRVLGLIQLLFTKKPIEKVGLRIEEPRPDRDRAACKGSKPKSPNLGKLPILLFGGDSLLTLWYNGRRKQYSND